MTRCAEIPPAPEGYLGRLVQDYVHPREVLADGRLSEQEKRSILCLWASDACAVDSRPGFRWLPGTPGPILFDHVIAALRSLDVPSSQPLASLRYGTRPSQSLHAGA
jgi:hypothetical protein